MRWRAVIWVVNVFGMAQREGAVVSCTYQDPNAVDNPNGAHTCN